MLTVALLLSAGMGIIQEKLYKEHGKHPDEALYYNVNFQLIKISKNFILNLELKACFNITCICASLEWFDKSM